MRRNYNIASLKLLKDKATEALKSVSNEMTPCYFCKSKEPNGQTGIFYSADSFINKCLGGTDNELKTFIYCFCPKCFSELGEKEISRRINESLDKEAKENYERAQAKRKRGEWS